MSFIPTKYKLIFIGIPASAVIAFLVMNWTGFMALMVSTGSFIVSSILNLFNIGLAGVWWAAQSVISFFANCVIGLINALIGAINRFLRISMPVWAYITPPAASATFQSILQDMGLQWDNIQYVAYNYWMGVQDGAPFSYAAGVGSAGVTMAAAAYATTKTGATTKTTTDQTVKSDKPPPVEQPPTGEERKTQKAGGGGSKKR